VTQASVTQDSDVVRLLAGTAPDHGGMTTTALPAAAAPRRPAWVTARTLTIVALVVALFVVALPNVSGAPWLLIGHQLQQVPFWQLGLLALLWAGGLLLHTITLTAALPGLSHRRALTLSLTGSAISNVLPFGGAAGIALNYRMIRIWGHDRAAFATYTVITNIWDVLVKLSLPLVALPVLFLTGSAVVGQYAGAALVATVTGAALLGLVAAIVVSGRATARVGAALDATWRQVLRAARVERDVAIGAWLVRLRSDCSSLVRSRWPRLTTGMLTYTATLAVLLWGCLYAAGAGLPLGAVLVGFAAERLLTLAGLTPGGAGLVEVGLAGLLVALGGDPVAVVSGVLLYRLFTFGLEIPVGGVSLAAWLWIRRGARPEPGDVSGEDVAA